MTYYRSGFIAADERAKAIQRYLDSANDKGLTDKQRYLHILNGNGFLHDLLMGSETDKKIGVDYYTRLEEMLIKLIEEEATQTIKLGYVFKFSLRTKANAILKLQLEYINSAGVFGRSGIKAIAKKDGEEDQIKEILEKEGEEDEEDVQENSVDV